PAQRRRLIVDQELARVRAELKATESVIRRHGSRCRSLRVIALNVLYADSATLIKVIRIHDNALSAAPSRGAQYTAISRPGSGSRKARTRLFSRCPHCSSSRPAFQAPPWSA